MSEREVIQASGTRPVTVESLRQDLHRLGVRPGMILLVHASLSTLGWVCGGPSTAILALEQTLGETGTLVMPAHSGDLSDPATWENPSVPAPWWETIRETMPAYAPDLTPTRGMGIIAETFRKRAGTIRSEHPQVSFAARGPQAEAIVHDHALVDGLGEASPLARIYELGGWVLLLGVGHENNTSLHLAEHRARYAGKSEFENAAPIFKDGHRTWATFRDLTLDTEDFERIGADFLADSGQSALRASGIGGNTADPSAATGRLRNGVDGAPSPAQDCPAGL